jgi:hypothetical protein
MLRRNIVLIPQAYILITYDRYRWLEEILVIIIISGTTALNRALASPCGFYDG